MITSYSDILALFEELDPILNKKVDVYMIGGGALMKHNLKLETKDVDLVVNSKEEFDLLTDALFSLGFDKEVPDSEVYGRMALSQILLRGDARVDLFCGVVCGKFALSERMIKRASLDLAINKLRLFVCSPNDIFLFKCMTEREGDLSDCRRMASDYILDWNAVLNEAVEQSVNEHSVWITWITDRMEVLSERGVNIPILEKMIALSDEYIEKWSREIEQL